MQSLGEQSPARYQSQKTEKPNDFVEAVVIVSPLMTELDLSMLTMQGNGDMKEGGIPTSEISWHLIKSR